MQEFLVMATKKKTRKTVAKTVAIPIKALEDLEQQVAALSTQLATIQQHLQSLSTWWWYYYPPYTITYGTAAKQPSSTGDGISTDPSIQWTGQVSGSDSRSSTY